MEFECKQQENLPSGCNFSVEPPSNTVREHNATSFLMGQSSVAYGGTAEKLALFFPLFDAFLDIWAFVD